MKVADRILRRILGPRMFNAVDYNLRCRTGRGVFPSFEEAREAIPKGRRVGFDNDRSAKLYNGRTYEPATSDYAVLYWLGPLLPEIRTIFDFGGNIGPTYYSYQKVMSYPPGLRWTVCDLPAVAREGERTAIERGASNLFFTTTIRDAELADVFLTRGALQYMEQDLGEMLGGLAVKPKHLFLNRVPLSDRPTYFTVQDIGPAMCAYKIQNRDELVGSLTAAGYELVDSWPCPDVRFLVRHGLKPRLIMYYSGMYLKQI